MSDLTSADGVKKLMISSNSEQEWNSNCDKVKAANNNAYPVFWYAEIIATGVVEDLKTHWVRNEFFGKCFKKDEPVNNSV